MTIKKNDLENGNHKLIKMLISKLVERPVFMHPKSHRLLVHILGSPEYEFDFSGFYDAFFAENEKQSSDKIAIIPVHGPLFNRSAGFIDFILGIPTYEQLKADFSAALADKDVEKIVFDIESPGGEASGLLDLSDFIYNSRGEKPIYAVVNDYAWSAAYGVASPADEVFITRTGSVGAIGVVAAHANQAKYDEKIGVEWEYITFGDKKVDGNPHEPLSDSARKDIKEEVDLLGNQFAETVARNLGVDKKSIVNTQAGTFMGEKAIDLGLAHHLMPVDDAYNTIRNANSGNSKGKKAEATVLNITQKKEVNLMDLKELQEKHPDLLKQIQDKATSELKTELESEKDKRVALEAKNVELQTQVDSTTEKNTALEGRVLELEKSETLRQERELKKTADLIWKEALMNSDLPEHLYEKVQKHVQYSKFVKEGTLDETSFVEAIQAEIKDWTDKGVTKSVLGSSVVIDKINKAGGVADDAVADDLFSLSGDVPVGNA